MVKKINTAQYCVSSDNSIDLSCFKTEQDGGLSRSELKELRNSNWKKIAVLHERLHAEKKQSLLIVLQAMDAAGKDSTIAKLTYNLSALGCNVHSFKKPTKLELAHDFLWRVHDKAPAEGELTIFNRSHYEDVLIVKVHGWADEALIEKRYTHINNIESLLIDNNTHVLKFMLHISPEYQLSRFNSRLENPEKYWKFNPDDLHERAHWDQYMEAFQTVLDRCSTDHAPWYVVPAENRRYRDALISSVVLQTLEKMSPEHPTPHFDIHEYKGKLS